MKPITEHRKFENIEEYFAFEEKSEVRHEYYLENLIEMSGTTYKHNDVVFYLTAFFRFNLQKHAYSVSSEQIKLYIAVENIFFYPDVMVALPEDKEYYSTRPVLIAEVLSESTRKFDMIDKFIQYQKLETLQYYLLAEPDKCLVIVHRKTADNGWQIDTYTSITDVIDLPALQISIALKDIYQA
ncbi:MAG: Uma2 family endonuclease [Ferruginibacter sp.]